MTDTRYWPKQFLAEFIEIYKNHTCLWKVKSKEYTNKNLKELAYNDLVVHCKKLFPEANRDFVTKKIQSIRGSFRKELHKIIDSKKNGAKIEYIHKPSLWYYNLLKFTTDQETRTVNILNLDEDSHIESINNGTDDEMRTLCGNEDAETQEIKEDTEYNFREMPITKDVNKQMSKRKKPNKSAGIESFIKVCKNILQEPNDMSEYEAVGINITKKLQRMDTIQALYAESLINEILRRGLLKKLTVNTDISETSVEVFATQCFDLNPKNRNTNSFKEQPGSSWEDI